MTRQDHFSPPRMASWLVNLFASSNDAESILGDLMEEFSQRALNFGMRSARAWYWRQTLNTTAHLFASGFRDAPGSTIAIVVAGYLLHKFVASLPQTALAAMTDEYLPYWSAHFTAYMFWATDGIVIAHLIGSLFVGFVMALAAKGSEMIAAVSLALILGAMIAAAWVWVAMHPPLFLGGMLWPCANPLAIVVAAAIVRTRRSAAANLVAGV
jgi:hypothetical protein